MVATRLLTLLKISLLFCVTAHAANYVLEADTSSYGYGPINSPGSEQYYNAVDGNIGSKYLNFNKTGAGITVGFTNARIMRRLIMTTANDASERDPMTINIYGSSTYNGAKTLIQSNVATNLSTNRYTASTIDFENNTSYQFYTIEVTSVRNPTYANSFQFSEVTFYYDTQYVANAAPTYSSGITAVQETRKNSETTQRLNQSGNEIQIEQIGDNNNITIRQGVTISGKNRIELYSNGDYNTLNLNQGYTTSGTVSPNDSNNHYLNLNLIGNNNTVTKQQTGTNNFVETTISGNTNNVSNIQQGTSGKILFQNISGNSNTVTTNQKDSGQHYLDIKLTGNGHNVGVTQEGTGNHAATIDLTNSGGAANLNLNQLGATNQVYSIQQSCVNAAGCSTTITQP
jgi:hypothetical protein